MPFSDLPAAIPMRLVAWTLALALAAGAAFPGTAAAQAVGADPTAAHPLTLEEALRLAEGASESVGIARAQLTRAGGDVTSAHSGFLPQLSGSATYTRTLNSQFSTLQSGSGGSSADCGKFTADPVAPIGQRVDSLERITSCLAGQNPLGDLTGNLPFGRRHQYSFGLAASQTLFDAQLFGRTKAARAARRKAEIALTAARVQLLIDVTSTYYDAALSQQLLAIAESTLALSERTLSETRVAREVGRRAEFDLLRAEVARDNQRPAVIRRRSERDQAFLRLQQLLDLPLGTPLALTSDPADTTLAALPEFARTIAAAADTAVESRAPVRQAAEDVAAREGNLQAARGQQIPTLTLASQYAQIGYPSSASPLGIDYVSDWSVTAKVAVPLFTGGRIRGEKEAAEAQLEEARLRLKQAREHGAREIQDLAGRLEAARATWAANQGTVEQASRAYQIAEVRYREGVSTQTELNDARLAYEQAEANRAQAARDFQVARMRVLLLRELPFTTN